MKKLLILIALAFTALGYSQAEFEKIALTENGVSTSTNKINTQETNGEINYIDAVNLPVSTATTNALELETDVSAGAVSGFTLTNNGNGTVNISSGIAYLRATNDPYAPIIKYPIAAVTNLALTDNANNYVLVDYNGGSPTLTVTTNGSTINTQTNSLAFLIARVGNNLDYLSLVGQNVDPNAKLRVRFLNQEGIRRASGAVLGFSNRNLTLTSSVLFSGLIRINAVAFNTASPDTFTLAYNNGSTWTRTTGQTQINNTQYNVSGTLTTMPNNTFRTDYVYLLPNNPSKLYVIMGTTTYNSLTLAKAAPRPSILPVELQAIGLEVGRLFIEKNSATIAEVQSSFANDFVGAPVPEHNSLTGLQGGTSGEYNHLTNAQVTLVDGSEQTTNKATSFSTVNNTLYPTVQAVKTYADGLVVGLLNDRGSYDASSNLFPSTGGSGTAGAILKGNIWAVSVAGTLGGVAVGIGDWIRALTDTPGQTSSNWSIVEGNFGYVPANDANVVHKTGDETFSGIKSTSNSSSPATGAVELSNSYNGGVSTSANAPFRLINNLNGIGGHFNNKDIGIGLSGLNESTGTLLALNRSADSTGDFLYLGTTGTEFFKVGYLGNTFMQGSLDVRNMFTYFGTQKGYIYINDDQINSYFSSDSDATLNINYFGYNNGTTRFRSTDFYNGKGGLILNLNGVNYNATFSGSVTATSFNGGATLTGTPTAPTQTAGDNSTKIATTAYVDSAVSAAAEPYLVYTALISQSGTDAPTATVLRNTTGGTVSYVYNSTGNYSANISGASYTLNKTIMKLDLGPVNPFYSFRASRLNSGSATLQTWNDSDTAADSLMSGSVLEIRIYP